jgi:hypothetical protein
MLLFVIYFLTKGALAPFREGIYEYAFGYAASVPLKELLPRFLLSLKEITAIDPVTWAAGIAGTLLFFLKKDRSGKISYFAFLAGGAAAVAMPRFFYGHYYLTFVPFLTLGAGLGAGRFDGKQSRSAAGLVFLAVVMAAAGTQARYLRMPAADLLQELYGWNPFYQSVALGSYLKAGAGRDGTAYIIGSEGQLLDYSGLSSPGRIFYFYPLMLPSTLRDTFRAETLAAIERTPPDYLVFVDATTSNFIHGTSDRYFLSRLFRLFSDYELVAISPFGSSSVLEGPALSGNLQLPDAHGAMLVFRRPDLRAPAAGMRFAKVMASL